MLSDPPRKCLGSQPRCLNAPSGAGCFLTIRRRVISLAVGYRLNAPSGAGCFLTLPLGVASLRRFQGLERHRLREHPAGLDGTAPI